MKKKIIKMLKVIMMIDMILFDMIYFSILINKIIKIIAN